MTKFNANYRGIGRMLRSDDMALLIGAEAVRIAQRARQIAPHRTGNYARHFGVSIEKRRDRVVAHVYNDDPGALAIEYGTRDTRAHRTLRTAATGRKP